MMKRVLVVLGLLECSRGIMFMEPREYVFDGLDDANKCMSRLERRIEGKDGVLVSHSQYGIAPYSGARNCLIMLAVPIGYRVRLRIIYFDVNGQHGKCDRDTLHVFDHETPIDPKQPHRPTDEAVTPGPMLGQFCGRITNTSELVVSRQNAMTLWWHTDPNLPAKHAGRGFQILWSAFRKELSAPCAVPLEFSCGNGECVPAEIACNSYADCSNDADIDVDRQIDNKCDNIALTSSGSSSAIRIFGLLAFFALIAASLCVCVCACTPNCDAKYRDDESDLRKEYTPATEDTTGSTTCRGGGAGAFAALQPQPPAFYPPAPPCGGVVPGGASLSHYERTYLQSHDNSSIRRLHHSAHLPASYPDNGEMTDEDTSHYYHKFIGGGGAIGGGGGGSGMYTDGSYAAFVDPPPTVCDSDYTYVRPPVVDSRII